MTVFERIYEAVKLIPEGAVATYGQVAEAAGNPRLSRAVGYALHVNPQPGVIPCHRVVKKDGEISRAFAFGGANRQAELLREEGVGFTDESHVDMARYRVPFLPMIPSVTLPLLQETSAAIMTAGPKKRGQKEGGKTS